MMARRRHVFVTGQPGVGKTTLIRRLLEQLSLLPAQQQLAASSAGAPAAVGFWTEEVRQGGERRGFDVVTLAGERGPLARVGTARTGQPSVGRYVVDVASFERLALPALMPLPRVTRLVVVDEVGKMELCSAAFFPAVLAVLDRPDMLVLGSVPAAPRSGRAIAQVEQVKARPDVQLVTVSKHNRDELVTSLSQQIEQAMVAQMTCS